MAGLGVLQIDKPKDGGRRTEAKEASVFFLENGYFPSFTEKIKISIREYEKSHSVQRGECVIYESNPSSEG